MLLDLSLCVQYGNLAEGHIVTPLRYRTDAGGRVYHLVFYKSVIHSVMTKGYF